MLGNGTKLLRMNDAGDTLVDMGHVATEIGDIEMTAETEEDTHYSQPPGKEYKEYYVKDKDAGEFNVVVEFAQDSQHRKSIQDDFESGLPRVYAFNYPDPEKTQLMVTVLVTKVGVTTPLGSKMRVPATLKITGAPVWGNWT